MPDNTLHCISFTTHKNLVTPSGAQDLLALGVKSVLIKGGHSLAESSVEESVSPDVSVTLGYAQDYFVSSIPQEGEERLCDGHVGVWLRTNR